jgi:hypothetical protein
MTTPNIRGIYRQHVETMTATEFAAAMRNRSWRDALLPMTTATPPRGGLPPTPTPGSGVKPAMAMTDDEFAAAFKAKAWRPPNR